MLDVRGLSVNVKGKFLIQDVSFQVRQGEIYGLIGANGAGKTTLIKALVGLAKLHGGIIKINNKPFDDISSLAKVGTLIERAPLYNHLSAYDNLRISAIQFGVHQDRINEVLSIIGLLGESSKLVKNFSLGMKQRLGLGLAILHNPDILILDEPTNGLDPEGIIQVRELLLSINRKSGTTILLASHLLTEMERVATHIGLIQKGLMVFDGTLESFKKMDSLENTYIKSSQ